MAKQVKLSKVIQQVLKLHKTSQITINLFAVFMYYWNNTVLIIIFKHINYLQKFNKNE